MRESQLWQRQTGGGVGKDDMDNICELLINVVNDDEPKTLRGSDQKVRGMDKAFRFRFTQPAIPPANRQILSHPVKSVEHGKPDCLHANGNRLAGEGDRQAGRGCQKKRMPSCNEADRGSEFARPERVQTSDSWSARFPDDEPRTSRHPANWYFSLLKLMARHGNVSETEGIDVLDNTPLTDKNLMFRGFMCSARCQTDE